MTKIEGYASKTSVVPGQPIDFHLSCQPDADVAITITRIGSPDVDLITTSAVTRLQLTPTDAAESGCRWQATHTFVVPLNWRCGLYKARMAHPLNPDRPACIFFVVRTRPDSARAPILFQLAVTTGQAYNPWPKTEMPGDSLYPSQLPERKRKVSFDRPQPIFYYHMEVPFIRWLEHNQHDVDFCTSIDLHREPELLDARNLLLSVGHDEYWSKEMRDVVERFIDRGGNVAFFGGNTCWWQIRFEDEERTMVCYKNALEDPLLGKDDTRLTIEWRSAPLDRPENYMTGLSFAQGAGIWQAGYSSQAHKGYKVRFAEHWAFAGTALKDGDVFGQQDEIIGYETDAAEFVESEGVPVATSRDGTPRHFVILSTCDLTDWDRCGKGGYATLGLFRRNGTVFNAGTIDWYKGIQSPDNPVAKITANVISRLKERIQPDEWEHIGGAGGITLLTSAAGLLYGVQKNRHHIWWRQPLPQNLTWRRMARHRRWRLYLQRPISIAALTAWDDVRLLAVTSDGNLVSRDSLIEDEPWRVAGRAAGIRALATMADRGFAITHQGRLLTRSCLNDPREEWQDVAPADNLVALTAVSASLFAVDASGRLMWWNLDSRSTWQQIGTAHDVISLTGLGGKLFAVTHDNRLMWRDVR